MTSIRKLLILTSYKLTNNHFLGENLACQIYEVILIFRATVSTSASVGPTYIYITSFLIFTKTTNIIFEDDTLISQMMKYLK